MLDRWQRFACFKTIDMLLDQTSARWTYILPAGAFTRYLRILSKNLGVGLSAFLRVLRRFRRCEPPIIAGFSASSTPFFEVVPGDLGPKDPRAFRRCEPPIMSGFSNLSTTCDVNLKFLLKLLLQVQQKACACKKRKTPLRKQRGSRV